MKNQKILKTQRSQKQESQEKVRIKKANAIFKTFSNSISNIKVNGEFVKTIELIKECNSKIITTGMGKAGIAMKKFSSTLCSLGIPACFIHPGEAVHGDMGVISNNDILFVASTSGKTREILDIIDLVRKNGIKCIIGITSHKDSPLRGKVDIVLDMGEIKEIGEIGMAPTTSIIIILAITDAIAILVSEEKGFKMEDFSKYHHSGYLGAISRKDNVIY